MTQISIIAAIDEQGGLGKDNQLLCHMPADLQYFKRMTLNKPIIMGFNTFQSIGKALPKRRNLVLSRRQHPAQQSIEFLPSLEVALATCKDVDEVMIIGGATLYQQAMPIADKLYITQIGHHFDADVFFPKIDLSYWQLIEEQKHNADDKNPHPYTFQIYLREHNGISN